MYLYRENSLNTMSSALVSRDAAERFHCIPVRRVGDRVVVAMADPLDLLGVNAMEESCGRHLEIRIATESDVSAAIQRVYAS